MKINKTSPEVQKYLQGISNIAKPPKTLYYIGKIPENRVPTLAVVGTRKPTSYGRDITDKLVHEIASRGVVIISGLALGIDAIAHKSTLNANGTTIAVLANSLPKISPHSNIPLAKDIIEKGGAIISEHSIDEPKPYVVNRWSFLERNRIVAGLSDAILITEASARSGTLNTAMHALNQGKDVFVVPGNITSPSSEGCNLLLKQGAIPVTCAQDVLDVIAPTLAKNNQQHKLPLGNTEAESAIIKQLSNGIHDAEIIQQNTKLSATDFSTAMTMLEIDGIIKPLGNNHWSLH